MNRPGKPTELINPTLLGALAALVTLLAVFISYNANNGLPFVPTYDIYIDVPDAEELSPNSQVRVGGYRVGFVTGVEARRTERGRVFSRVSVKLDIAVKPLREDSRVRIRPQSLLGLKYVEVLPGPNGKAIPAGGTLGADRALPNVDIEEVFAAFDPRTRANVERLLTGVGSGVAGRGQNLNEFFATAPAFLRDLNPVLADLARPSTRIGDTAAALARLSAEVSAVAPQLAALLADGATTLGAIERAGPEFERALRISPGTARTATEALEVLGPVLAKANAQAGRLLPASRRIPAAARNLEAIVETGTPVLRDIPRFSGDLEGALRELRELATDHPTVPTLRALADGVPLLANVVEHVAPLQLRCDYLATTLRNAASAGAEGSNTGTWLRFTPILDKSDEVFQRSTPAPDLHFNPYPNYGAPGQPEECEAGREGWLPGLQLGNVPGTQGEVRSTSAGGRR